MRMRSNAWMAVLVAVACLGATGCWYQRPDVEDWYEDVEIGWEKQKVVDKLGRPTVLIENDMMYVYDATENPVRLRFVLDEEGKVDEKYYESKEELAKRLEEAERRIPPVELVPGEEERGYPGAPLERFEKKPGEPGAR